MIKKICIIPARGGSKRIPKKNIKNFLGKPIIAYSIEAAINSKLFDEVMVSTDDEIIAKIAKNYGAKVPFMRSNKAASDYATTFEVIEEVLIQYQNRNEFFEFACCLYACAPFVTNEKLVEAYNLLQRGKFDCVFPMMPFGFPIQRGLKLANDNKVSFVNPEYSLMRSQDLEKNYHDVGQFYWMNTKKCISKKAILTDNTGGVVISELEGQDIDNEIDWKLAELKYELLQNIK